MIRLPLNFLVLVLAAQLANGCAFYHSHFPKIDQPDRAPGISSLIPADGDRSVSPDIEKLVVRFDRSMLSGTSIRTHGPNPRLSKPYWRSPVELVIPVALEPESDYVLELNGKRYTSFIDKQGFSLVPYRWEFSTTSVPQ